MIQQFYVLLFNFWFCCSVLPSFRKFEFSGRVLTYKLFYYMYIYKVLRTLPENSNALKEAEPKVNQTILVQFI